MMEKKEVKIKKTEEKIEIDFKRLILGHWHSFVLLLFALALIIILATMIGKPV